jgi:hypothetical protein
MTTDPCAAVADPSHPIPPRRLHQLPAPLQQWLVGAIEIGVRRSCEFHDELPMRLKERRSFGSPMRKQSGTSS